jgi:hypothetical protein
MDTELLSSELVSDDIATKEYKFQEMLKSIIGHFLYSYHVAGNQVSLWEWIGLDNGRKCMVINLLKIFKILKCEKEIYEEISHSVLFAGCKEDSENYKNYENQFIEEYDKEGLQLKNIVSRLSVFHMQRRKMLDLCIELNLIVNNREIIEGCIIWHEKFFNYFENFLPQHLNESFRSRILQIIDKYRKMVENDFELFFHEIWPKCTNLKNHNMIEKKSIAKENLEYQASQAIEILETAWKVNLNANKIDEYSSRYGNINEKITELTANIDTKLSLLKEHNRIYSDGSLNPIVSDTKARYIKELKKLLYEFEEFFITELHTNYSRIDFDSKAAKIVNGEIDKESYYDKFKKGAKLLLQITKDTLTDFNTVSSILSQIKSFI